MYQNALSTSAGAGNNLTGNNHGDHIIAHITARVAKATGDHVLAHSLYFSPDVIEYAIKLLRAGVNIVCDTVAIKSEIRKIPIVKLGSMVHCFIDDPEVQKDAKSREISRQAAAMDRTETLYRPLIYVVGNSAASLMRVYELYTAGKIDPRLIIAAPVGFVDVAESKELFIDSGIPVIAVRGKKGGSEAALAILNTLLDIAAPRHN